MKRTLIALLAETHIHPGEGQAKGVVDQPVAREATAKTPFIPGHSQKGAIKAGARNYVDDISLADRPNWLALNDAFDAVFGDTDREGTGRLLIGDAQLVLLPLRAREYPFVLATSRYLLRRLARTMAFTGLSESAKELEAMVRSLSVTDRGYAVFSDDVSVASDAGSRKVEIQGYELIGHGQTSTPAGKDVLTQKSKVAVGESPAADMDVRTRLSAFLSETLGLAGIVDLKLTLTILQDADFDFFANTALPVRARNHLDENKRSLNLWYEETLPPDTVMCTWLGERELIGERDEHGNLLEGSGESPIDLVLNVMQHDEGGPRYLQIGGNESVGQGWFRVFPRPATGVHE